MGMITCIWGGERGGYCICGLFIVPGVGYGRLIGEFRVSPIMLHGCRYDFRRRAYLKKSYKSCTPPSSVSSVSFRGQESQMKLHTNCGWWKYSKCWDQIPSRWVPVGVGLGALKVKSAFTGP